MGKGNRMSVTEYHQDQPFFYRIVSDHKKTEIIWSHKKYPVLFTGKAYSHEEKIEQYKQAVKEIIKLEKANKL